MANRILWKHSGLQQRLLHKVHRHKPMTSCYHDSCEHCTLGAYVFAPDLSLCNVNGLCRHSFRQSPSIKITYNMRLPLASKQKSLSLRDITSNMLPANQQGGVCFASAVVICRFCSRLLRLKAHIQNVKSLSCVPPWSRAAQGGQPQLFTVSLSGLLRR